MTKPLWNAARAAQHRRPHVKSVFAPVGDAAAARATDVAACNVNLFDALQRYPLQTALKGCGLSQGAYRRARLDPDFARQADAAIAAREAGLVDVVRMATVEDWQAAKFLLERTAGFHEVKETRAMVQLEIEKLLDALEPHMTPGAFGELLQGLAIISGHAPKALAPA